MLREPSNLFLLAMLVIMLAFTRPMPTLFVPHSCPLKGICT